MTGYIDLENLNDELRELIIREVSMAKVLSVNSKEPDATGNVDTDFKIIEPMGMEATPSDYPHGNSEFITDISMYQLPANLMVKASRNTGNKRVLVRTHIDEVNNVYLQEVDDNENGIFEPTFYRFSIDGIVWSDLERVKRIKTINGITPDETHNLTIPMASIEQEGLVKVDGETITVDPNGVISVISSAPKWNEF